MISYWTLALFFVSFELPSRSEDRLIIGKVKGARKLLESFIIQVDGPNEESHRLEDVNSGLIRHVEI